MKNYKKFVISFKPFAVELVSGMLWELDINGIVEQENFLEVFSVDSKEVTEDKIGAILKSMVYENILESFEISEYSVENKNWNEDWEKKVNIVHVTDKIVIAPSFKEYTPKAGQIVIIIDPKMSFGTGEHQTTKLVLELTEKYIQPGDKVLDVGSGTGILAIGSVKMGAGYAIGIDNDEWCLLNGRENVEINKVSDKVKIVLSEIKELGENNFDLILANINKHILLDIKHEIKDKIKPGGRLILSGLLIEDEEDINKSYRPIGFKLIKKITLDEWIALVYHSE